jgi:hypothetical protein
MLKFIVWKTDMEVISSAERDRTLFQTLYGSVLKNKNLVQ